MRVETLTVGPLSANCYLVTAPDVQRGFLVDPGMDALDRVNAAVDVAGVDIEAIVLTHGHIDHVANAAACADKYDAPVYIHSADKFMLEPGSECPQHIARALGESIDKQPAEVRELTDGEELELIGKRLRVHHAPGHSPGCIMVEADDFVLTGDVLFRGAIGRVDLPYSEPAAMQHTLKTKVKQLRDDLTVYPGHGLRSVMGDEKLTNPFLVGTKVVR